MKIRHVVLSLVLGLPGAGPGAQIQPQAVARVEQLGPAGNVALVEQRHTDRASLTLHQEGGARAGTLATGEAGVLQIDSARVAALVRQQGEADVRLRQQDVYLGWAKVLQVGAGQSAAIVQRSNADVQTEISQTGSGHRSTQSQTGIDGGIAFSRQGGADQRSSIEQAGSRKVAAAVLQDGGQGGELSLVQRNMQYSSATIWQSGDANKIGLQQSDGVAVDTNVYQFGSALAASIVQTGANFSANVQQSGTVQSAVIRQR